ncbi:MAG TPA: hypothetical protein VMP01_18845 [Pirellulaceae bacterium]|nr:hypothetical protein [Pirellulaceae bacterium]
MLIGACVVVAGAAAFWITRPAVPFDEAFRECKQDEAEWRLVVNYSIVGIDGDEKFVAHYCHRQPPKTSVVSGSWLHWWEPSVDEWEEVGGPGILKEFSHACGIGTDGNWVCNYSTKAGTQTAAGVDLSVEHGRSGDPASVISETISLPFPETVACRKGKISYVATWESLK